MGDSKVINNQYGIYIEKNRISGSFLKFTENIEESIWN